MYTFWGSLSDFVDFRKPSNTESSLLFKVYPETYIELSYKS